MRSFCGVTLSSLYSHLIQCRIYLYSAIWHKDSLLSRFVVGFHMVGLDEILLSKDFLFVVATGASGTSEYDNMSCNRPAGIPSRNRWEINENMDEIWRIMNEYKDRGTKDGRRNE